MFGYLKEVSLSRKAWLLLIITSIALEGTALYFQHGMGLKPCVMCIYERLALLAIFVASLFGMLAPKVHFIRLTAIAVALYGAIKGLSLAIKHVDYQLNPAPWNQCTFMVDFPETLPLNKWFPNLFEASGSCNDITWQMWGLTMPQWLIAVFAVYCVIFVLMALSQLKRTKTPNRTLFK